MTSIQETQQLDPPKETFLEVPHYYQLDSNIGVDPEEARKICALVCMRTILEYKLKGDPTFDTSIPTLRHLALENGGKAGDGWKHSAEVSTFLKYGVTAWRRNWKAPTQDPAWLIDNESYNQAQARALTTQQEEEPNYESLEDRALFSIMRSLQKGSPVIASMLPEFGDNTASHQIVIHGYADDGKSLLITDPIEPDAAHQTELKSTNRFLEYFSYKAIFVE